MEPDNNTISTAPANAAVMEQKADAPANSHEDKKIRDRRRCVTVGFIFVLAGWATMMLNEWISLGCTVVGLILSCIGVRIPPGPRRDFATTAIVAASVLLLVFALFAVILFLI